MKSTLLLALTTSLLATTGAAQDPEYCFGDPGADTPCPCNNDNDGSVPGSGCANGVFASGARLTATGGANLAADTLVLATTHTEPNNAGLYFQADNDLRPGLVWGDGLRCAGGNLRRLGVRFSDSSGYSDTSGLPQPISLLAGNVLPGDTKFYQCWYRTTIDPPCGSGVNDFNTSNGYAITWVLHIDPYDGMAPVPSGYFNMGDHHGVGGTNELPVHPVYVDALYVDEHEVSNRKYADYLNTAHAQGLVTVSAGDVYQVGAAGQRLGRTTTSSVLTHLTWDGSTFGVVSGKEDHPVVQVSWYGACTYANQKSRDHGLSPCYEETTWACDFDADGFRLPTEAEWEYVARGGDYGPYYQYPWGNSIDGSMANFLSSGDPYESGADPRTTPVGYYDGNQVPPGVDMANGYGLYDTSGNVSEWCWDWYAADYYTVSPFFNPTGPATGTWHVIRGGSWSLGGSAVRSAYRWGSVPGSVYDSIGFRIVAAQP